MRNPGTFQLSGVLLADTYLLGVYALPEAFTLRQAVLCCVPPTLGMLIIELEVNGVLTGESFVVMPVAAAEYRETKELTAPVPANAELRWKAVFFDGTPETAARHVSITI